MTSFAFIFGVFPLGVATGPGGNGRIAIGTAVIGGMLTATILAVFYIPLFYVLVRQELAMDLPSFASGSAGAARRRHETVCRDDRATVDSMHDAGAEARTTRSGNPSLLACWRCSAQAIGSGSAAITYRDIFRDGRLQTLIGEALVNNRDLMAAASNIQAALEQYHIQRAQQFPQLNAASA